MIIALDFNVYCMTELMADLLEQKPEEETSLDNIIVVDNAPIVGPDRMGKLKNVLKKIFQRFGEIVTEYYPTNENDESKGYILCTHMHGHTHSCTHKHTHTHAATCPHTYMHTHTHISETGIISTVYL